MIKIHAGTPIHSEHLCVTCRSAHIVKGVADSDERTFCDRMPSDHSVIRSRVVTCSSYDDKRHASRWDMEQIAWVLVTKKAGKVIGFKAPRRNGDDDTPGFAP